MAEHYPIIELSGPAPALERGIALLDEHGCLGTETVDDDLVAYFPESTDARALAELVRSAIPELSCTVPAPLPSRDWLAEWKAGLEGFPIGRRYFVLPTWRDDVETARTVLRIDPEQAFGTGTHETTAMCVELLEEHARDARNVIDVGTGTAILAMVAAHEGAGSVHAFDVDPDAVRCARANVERNGLADSITVTCESWTDHDAIEASLVVANLNSAILSRAAPRFYGTLILSGILSREVDELAATLPGDLVERRAQGEWSALVMKRDRRA